MPDAHRREGRIILVRHGETEANRLGYFAVSDDIPLTVKGREQARALALSIQQQFSARKVFSSEFRRARQTAEVIAGQLGLQVEVIPGIHERNFGALKGQPYREMGCMMRNDASYDPRKRSLWAPENGESLESVRLRAVAALQNVLTLSDGKDIVVVSHGAVMESIAAHLSEDWESASVPQNCGILLIERSRLFS
jgi:broad specificity phosphatase PhoE